MAMIDWSRQSNVRGSESIDESDALANTSVHKQAGCTLGDSGRAHELRPCGLTAGGAQVQDVVAQWDQALGHEPS
jgi:hypothetical protein